MIDDPQRYQAAIELFERCLPLDADGRRELLALACGSDAEMRLEVEGMLAADEREDTPVIHDLVDRALEAANDDSPPPDAIGPYRVVGEIGRGGMGIVYEAEQPEPRRRVALKVLSAFGSRTMAQRLRREANVLAQLDHPGIAKVFDAGVAEFRGQSTPYIAMELIRGLPLDEHARRRGLDLRQRVELLARVADAVHAAHERGVVHRDLKPGNILVVESDDPVGLPKVLDFGVASVRKSDLAVTTLRTETGQLIGTLNYMSPEQLDGHSKIDERTDVYGLGVIAFEILSGGKPVDLDGLSIVQAVEQLRNRRDPTLTVEGKPAPRQLALIIASAIAREPGRRYAGAAAFAADLRGYLAGTDIQARPPGASYQLREFARRNRVLVAVAIATLATLTVGLIGTTAFGVSATLSEHRAQWITHRAVIAAAGDAIERADFVAARRLLDDSPARFRGWEWDHLNARLNPSVPAFGGEPIDFLGSDRATGCFIAVQNGELVRWDPAEGAPTRIGIAGEFTGLSPEAAMGKAAATFEDGAAIVFDVATGDVLLRIEPRPDDAWKVPVLSAATPRLMVANSDGRAVFDIETAEQISSTPMIRFARSHVISPDGLWLATTNPNSYTFLFSVQTGELRRVRHPEPGSRVAFSPDGSMLAVGTSLRVVHLIDTATGETVRTLSGHTGVCTELVFTGDGRLATAFNDGSWRLWDVASGSQLEAHPLPGEGASLAALGNRVVGTTRGDDGPRIWNVDPARDVLEHPRFVYALAWSPDGSLLASTAYEGGHTVVWDVASRRAVARLETEGRRLPTTGFTRDASHFFSGQIREGVTQFRAWRTDDWSRIAPDPEERDIVSLWGDTRGLRLPHARYSPDGRLAARLVTPFTWAVERDGRETTSFEHEATVRACAWSPDGATLVLGSQPGDAIVREATDFDEIARLPHPAGLWCAEFSPDGTRLATGGDDGIVRLYDTRRWDLVLELRGHSSYVHAVAFSPDGTRLASGSGDGTVRLWDSLSQEERAQRVGSASLRRSGQGDPAPRP